MSEVAILDLFVDLFGSLLCDGQSFVSVCHLLLDGGPRVRLFSLVAVNVVLLNFYFVLLGFCLFDLELVNLDVVLWLLHVERHVVHANAVWPTPCFLQVLLLSGFRPVGLFLALLASEPVHGGGSAGELFRFRGSPFCFSSLDRTEF